MNLLLYFFALFSLSQAGNLARFAQARPEVLGFWRLFGASLIILLFLLLQRKEKLVFTKKGLLAAFFSGLFFFIHLWTYKYGAQNTLIAHLMILFSLHPVSTALTAQILGVEEFNKKLLLPYLLAFLGVIFLVWDGLQLSGSLGLGHASSLMAALFYSFYMLTGKSARHSLSNSVYTITTYSTASLLFLITASITQAEMLSLPDSTWLAILALIFFPTLLGHASFTYLVKYFDVNWMSIGKLLEPLFAVIVAYFIFNEKLSLTTGIAFALIGSATILLITIKRTIGLSNQERSPSVFLEK